MKRVERECENDEEERVLLAEDRPEGLVFFPHEGGGTFLPIVLDLPKSNAAPVQ